MTFRNAQILQFVFKSPGNWDIIYYMFRQDFTCFSFQNFILHPTEELRSKTHSLKSLNSSLFSTVLPAKLWMSLCSVRQENESVCP